jgi:hypothetical protein
VSADRDFAAILADCLEAAITRNPGLSKDVYDRYVHLIAEYRASVETGA